MNTSTCIYIYMNHLNGADFQVSIEVVQIVTF